jgi:hypothetical protein
MTIVANAPSSNRLSRVFVRRRRKGNLKNRNAAKALPPPSANIGLRWLRKAAAAWPVALDELLAAVVLTVSVAVTAAVPLMAGGAAMEQVGRSTAFVGPVTAQESATEPVKPPLGLIVIVEVPLMPGVAMLTVVLVSAKLGAGGGAGAGGGGGGGAGAGAVTVTAMIAVLVSGRTAPLESTAFTDSVYCPGVVPGCVWIMTVVVAGAFPEIVTGGMDEQVGTSFALTGELLVPHSRVTLPEKPFVGVIVRVEVPVAPATMETAVPLSVRPGGTTVRDTSAEVPPP